MLQSANILNLMALATLLPATFLGFRKNPACDRIFWIILFVAPVGPIWWLWTAFESGWRTDLGATLWVSVAATMIFFIILAVRDSDAWRLVSILSPTALFVGFLATVWSNDKSVMTIAQKPELLIIIHIAVSIATYSLVTIAAVAALAALAQEKALRGKRPIDFTRALPAVTRCDDLILSLLVAGEWVLGVGLLTGAALTYGKSGIFLHLDHKTILTVTAFIIIGGLLVAHFHTGLRGRRAAKVVLVAYLFLTLGYPGVKFVTDIIMA
ncbi:MAG: hypothetical protein CBB68_03880 [Rhodospirillaceae bacterium TMED8]|nr:hypothetical protein [Magnetovibrio sp.]OUT52015.1 MAG: hypothetical protein CBB68_03880 [Rhodospirillaceae bacterium TMED8]|tara:strand:- start:3554 stop:4357 length:804 start_codon:yes stop_codon:yes gene_type:complete